MRAPHGSSRATFVNGEGKANGDKSLGRRPRLAALIYAPGPVRMFLSFENSALSSIGASWGPSISSSHLHSCTAGTSCGHYCVRG
jgi:hypothetical protein